MLKEPTPITAFFAPSVSSELGKRERFTKNQVLLPSKRMKLKTEPPQTNKIPYESLATEFQKSEVMLACVQELRLFQRSGACGLHKLQRVLKNIFIHYEIKKRSDQLFALRSAGIQVLDGNSKDLLLYIETPYDDHSFRYD